MILSVSRRTDIPAFYSKWFFRRLEEGCVLVRNPMNHRQVSSIALSPSTVDCIVFWTKDPSAMLDRLDNLSGYHYYFLITVNAYGKNIERNLPDAQRIVGAFRTLSGRIGPKRTVWRYDPIIITDSMDIEYHCRHFGELASLLDGYTERCIISFFDEYQKTRRNMRGIGVVEPDDELMTELAARLSEIACRHGIRMYSCCENIDPARTGVEHGSCIDAGLISEITGKQLSAGKDKNQRDTCRCAESVDIGAYNSCGSGCRYCYANYSDETVRSNMQKHDPDSPMLVGNIEPGDRITQRDMRSLFRPCGSQVSIDDLYRSE